MAVKIRFCTLKRQGEVPCLVVAHGNRIVNVVSNHTNFTVPFHLLLKGSVLGLFLAFFQVRLLADQVACVFLVLSSTEHEYLDPRKGNSRCGTFFFLPISLSRALSWDPI